MSSTRTALVIGGTTGHQLRVTIDSAVTEQVVRDNFGSHEGDARVHLGGAGCAIGSNLAGALEEADGAEGVRGRAHNL